METHVKERLVGAVILVILIVILVPELLSGSKHESPPSPPPLNLQAEPEPGSVRTYTIDLSTPDAPDAPQEHPAETPKPTALPAPQTQQQEVQQSSAPAPVTAPAQKPVEEKPSPPFAPTPTPAPAATSAPSKPAVSTSETSGWSVQLGSFSNRENAARLVKELNGRGYKAFISQTGSGAKTRYRARVGPESTRAGAEALARRLKAENRQVAIVPNS